MKFTELDPRWYSAYGTGHRHGITFYCPCCAGKTRLAVAVHVDGTNFDPDPTNSQQFAAGETVWNITGGDDFSNLSLSPSIDASKHGHWHGFITNGEVS